MNHVHENDHRQPTRTPTATGGGGATQSEFARDRKPADLTPMLRKLLTGATLSVEETTGAFEMMMTGQAHHGEIGALLALLATRTPTRDELLGAARVMRQHVERVPTAIDPRQIVDTAGTGGAPKTFNVSTAAAVVAAACGAKVAKHGNRSRTGRGSAEVLTQLGVNVDADRQTQSRCLDEVGVCFCFAIHHHPATKHVMPVRLALGVPTIFNLLGPLTNPAGAGRQLMGVYAPQFLQPIAEAHAALGTVRAMIVHSDDGLDEISLSAKTRVMSLEHGTIAEQVIDPEALGLQLAPLDAVQANDLDHAGRMVREVLGGDEKGAPRDMTLLNAAATLVVAGIAEDMAEGLERSRQAIDSGAASATLTQLASLSQ